MKEGDKFTLEAEIVAVHPEWCMVKVPSVRGHEYARVPIAALKPVRKAKEPA